MSDIILLLTAVYLLSNYFHSLWISIITDLNNTGQIQCQLLCWYDQSTCSLHSAFRCQIIAVSLIANWVGRKTLIMREIPISYFNSLTSYVFYSHIFSSVMTSSNVELRPPITPYCCIFQTLNSIILIPVDKIDKIYI